MLIKAERSNPAQGRILISEPFLRDFYFQRSIVLLAEHTNEGSFGLIMNKPADIRLHDVLNDFPEFDTGIYFGGPVKTDSIFFIHRMGESISNSMKIMDDLYWGGDIEAVHEMIISGKITADNIRFYLGYSGWSAKQLDNELKENSWLVADVRATQLWKSTPDKMWKSIVSQLGSDYSDWINYPSDPSLN